MAEDQHREAGERDRDEERQGRRDQERPGPRDDRRSETGLPDPLLDVVADPSQGRHRLPYLLGLLDDDDPHVRLTAGTAVCLVAESAPDLRGSAVKRLVDRVDGDAPAEAALALGYLATRDPETVDEVASELTDESERRVRNRLSRHGTGFVRSEYLAPTGGGRRVGRARLAGGDGADDPRRVYEGAADADPRTEESEREDRSDRSQETGGDGEHEVTDDEAVDDEAADDESDDGEAPEASGDGTAAGNDSGTDDGPPVTSGTLRLVSKHLADVVDASAFDELSALTDGQRGRHGDVYRTAGTHDGDEYAVALTVYHLPGENRDAFATGLRDALDAWCDVHDHRAILAVYDWAIRPRPWAAVEYADATLASREDDPPPLGTALELAGAVGYAHRRGVVHGAVDPRNVAYRDTALIEGARRQPLLTDVGLAVGTGTDTPGVGVDPHYAAPEHYDDSYGRVDHSTDVYGLGALLYRLCTGRHPFAHVVAGRDGADDADDADDANVDAVRSQVLSSSFPQPTSVNPNLPRAIDQIVAKATATRKLKRYETVTQFERELRSVGESGGAR